MSVLNRFADWIYPAKHESWMWPASSSNIRLRRLLLLLWNCPSKGALMWAALLWNFFALLDINFRKGYRYGSMSTPNNQIHFTIHHNWMFRWRYYSGYQYTSGSLCWTREMKEDSFIVIVFYSLLFPHTYNTYKKNLFAVITYKN